MKPSKLDLERASSRISGYIRKTPLLRSDFLSNRWDADVYLKCEQFQEIGAFKIRGAANFALQLSADQKLKGVVTHSSGNHAQAVACMASKLGMKADIVMPENSNKVKIHNTERWGATIHFCEPTIAARKEKADAIQSETNAVFIPPFNHSWIVEGQATCAMEILSEDHFDVISTPLGGGGLLAGTALAAEYFGNDAKVIGTEPDQASDGYRGFKSGIREENVVSDTVADGLRTSVGEIPFQIITDHVDDVFLAKESEILPWMFDIWRQEKLIIEPSCAVPFAALDSQKDVIKGKKVAIVITGGNVDLNQFVDSSP